MEETYVKSSQVFFYALLDLCASSDGSLINEWVKSSLDLIITTLLYKFADFNLDENEEWTGHSLAVDKVWHLALGDLFLLLSLLMTNFEWKNDYSQYVLLPLQHLLLKHLLDLGHHLSRVVLVIIDYWAYFLDEKVMTQNF